MVWKSDSPATDRSRYLPLVITTGLALAILGGTIFLSALYVRQKSRSLIMGQNARILYELWLSQKFNEGADSLISSGEKVSDELRSLLETARLPQLTGLLGTRLFDTDGACVWADPTIVESPLPREELTELRQLKPVARWHPKIDLSEVATLTIAADPVQASLLEVCIPLHALGKTSLVGIAQFLLNGNEVAAEFKALDRTLMVQASFTFLAGGGLLAVVLGIGFDKLQRANQLLSERTQSLLRANQELALAAKTSAVGAVTAHLIHGLRNPLSGLQSFVASRGAATEEASDSEWQMAALSTRRMQTMISEIVNVLRDEGGDAQYEMSLAEFAEMIEARVRPLAQGAGVEFRSQLAADGTLRNREANLLSLVLYNLVQNAVQATPPGKRVTLSYKTAGEKVACEVIDEGPGVAESQRAQLFQPCRSSKEGGSGIGLAISKQLANCIGAELVLLGCSSAGSVFRLLFACEETGKDCAASQNSAAELPARC